MAKPTLSDAVQRLDAWNTGDTDAIPANYEPNALDWQVDLVVVLEAARVGARAAAHVAAWEAAEAADLTMLCDCAEWSLKTQPWQYGASELRQAIARVRASVKAEGSK